MLDWLTWPADVLLGLGGFVPGLLFSKDATFAVGCLAVALAAGLIGAAVGIHQLISAASVILIICAVTVVLVIATETWAGR
jgi:hypothetical protein